MDTTPANPSCVNVDAAALRARPLPMPSSDGAKEQRGHVLILGGSREMPGAVILAATAALRAGAGKLTIAAGASVAQLVALALPEPRVIGLAETGQDGFTDEAVSLLDPLADKVNAILIDPGMQDEAATAALVSALLPRLDGSDTSIVLDACAMGVILSPDQDDEGASPFRSARDPAPARRRNGAPDRRQQGRHRRRAGPPRGAGGAALERGAGAEGRAHAGHRPDGARWQHEGGNVGLAISGSGDTLAGILAGLAARGAALHARGGERPAERFGILGYLVREIPNEIPALMEAFARG